MRSRSSSLLRPLAEKWAAVEAGLDAAADLAGAAPGFGAGFVVWAVACTARNAMKQRTSRRMAQPLLAVCSMRLGPGTDAGFYIIAIFGRWPTTMPSF